MWFRFLSISELTPTEMLSIEGGVEVKSPEFRARIKSGEKGTVFCLSHALRKLHAGSYRRGASGIAFLLWWPKVGLEGRNLTSSQ